MRYALKRILQLAMATMLSVRKISEQLVQSMMESVMGACIVFFGFSEKIQFIVSGIEKSQNSFFLE